MNKFRNLGSNKKFHHDLVGINSRMDTLQAAILDFRLKKLPSVIKKRRQNSRCYAIISKIRKDFIIFHC